MTQLYFTSSPKNADMSWFNKTQSVAGAARGFLCSGVIAHELQGVAALGRSSQNAFSWQLSRGGRKRSSRVDIRNKEWYISLALEECSFVTLLQTPCSVHSRLPGKLLHSSVHEEKCELPVFILLLEKKKKERGINSHDICLWANRG